jgi:hypothetical protein
MEGVDGLCRSQPDLRGALMTAPPIDKMKRLELVEALRAANVRIRDLEAELSLAKDKIEDFESDMNVLQEGFEEQLERLRGRFAEFLERREVATVIRSLQVAGELPWDLS